MENIKNRIKLTNVNIFKAALNAVDCEMVHPNDVDQTIKLTTATQWLVFHRSIFAN